MRKYNEERGDSGLYIGDFVKKDRIKLWIADHRRLTHAAITLAFFLLFLEIYGTLDAAKNFFGTMERETNPLALLADMIRNHSIATLVIAAVSYGLASVIMGLLVNEKTPRYEENARGEITDAMGTGGRGSIAKKSEIELWARFTSDYDTMGTILGDFDDGEDRSVICKPYVEPGSITDFTHQLKNDHMLLAAPSSSGKTTNFIPHNIINHMLAGHSLITTDPSGELFEMLAPVARHLGYKVRILNLRPDEMHCSDGCDFLKPLRNASDPETMADDFCSAILMNVGAGKDSFWNQANINLLSLVLLYVAHAKGFIPLTTTLKRDKDGNIIAPGPKERVFREVAAYIEDPVSLKANIDAAIAKDPAGDGKLLGGRFRTWSTNKEKDQIASGLSTSLSIFRNKRVSEVMSQDDMSADLLVNERAIYFIILDPLNDSFKPITSLYFTSVFQELFRIATKLPKNWIPRMVYIFLEEFQSLGLITKLPAALDNIRKHNVGIALCTQELAMVEEIYGTGPTINMLNDCLVQMCMGTNSDYPSKGILTNASFFSKMSGMQTVRETYATEHRHKWIPEAIQEITVMDQNVREQVKGSEVYMSDDVYRLKGDEVLIRASMHNPFIAKRFYWERHPMSGYIVRNKFTGERFNLKACDHVPHYKSGTEDLFDPSMYEIVDKKIAAPKRRNPAGKETSGVSYTKFL